MTPHMKLLFIKNLLIACLLPLSCYAASVEKSYEQKALEIFDSACVKNHYGEKGLEGITNTFGGKEIEQEKLKFDPVLNSLGGRAFIIPYLNEKFIVAHAAGGGCSLIVEKFNSTAIHKIITQNYPLEHVHTENSGIQIIDTYLVRSESFLKGSAILISYGKPESGFKFGILGFVNKEALGKV